MSFNPRQSNVFRSSQNQAPPSSTTRGRQQQQQASYENYLLIRDDEIVDCISELGIPFQLDDLKKPSSPKIQLVFEMFADLLMGIRKDAVEPILRSASEQLEFPETQQDAHTLMAFYVSLRTLMLECGIEDFTINDLAKPDTVRLTRILSYVINFTRFREARAGVIDEHFQKAEKAKESIEQLYLENEELTQRLQALKQQRAKEEPMIKRAKEVQKMLGEELYAFSKREKSLTNEMNKLKQEKESYVKTLEDRQYFVTKTLQEAEKIRPYIVDSPDKLQQVITDMGASLAQEKATVDSVERKSRALQTSADSFAIVEQDVMSTIKVMEECEQELIKEEENARKAARHYEILTQKQTEVRETERSEQRLQRQLQNATEKITRTRETGEAKSSSAQKKMRELKEAYKQLSKERAERDKDMEKKKMRIERIEKEMADMKEKVEEEVMAAHVEFAKMKSHIALYVSEMEQCI